MLMHKNILVIFWGKYYTKKALYGRKETDMTGVTKDMTIGEILRAPRCRNALPGMPCFTGRDPGRGSYGTWH